MQYFYVLPFASPFRLDLPGDLALSLSYLIADIGAIQFFIQQKEVRMVLESQFFKFFGIIN